MTTLGNGLFGADHFEDALSVKETELSMRRRLGSSEENMLVVQSNLANSYLSLGRLEEASSMQRDVYSGRLKVNGEQHIETFRAASNYAASLVGLERFEEAKSLLRKTIPVARRVLGEGHDLTLKMRKNYARALYLDAGATLDDLREAVTTFEETSRIARRVLGGAHPLTKRMEIDLKNSRTVLRARETPST